jgi:hypothetical protein
MAINVNESKHVAVSLASTDYSDFFSKIYVGGTGNVKIDGMDGVAVTFYDVPIGILPVGGKKIYKTGTTATNIVACSY